MNHEFKSAVYLTAEQLTIAIRLCDAEIAAKHNHIASAVEDPEHWNKGNHSAESMVRELRKIQAIRVLFVRELREHNE